MSRCIRQLTPILFTTAFAATPVTAPGQTPPPRWVASGAQLDEFEITRDATVAHTGRVSIRIRATEPSSSFATVSTRLPAQSYVGHRIRFSVFLRAQGLGGVGGQLWVRADGANRPSLAFANTLATPFRGSSDWTQLTVILDIPENATQIALGALSTGAGSLWVDDAHIEADGVAPLDFGFENDGEFTPPPATPRRSIAREAPRALSA